MLLFVAPLVCSFFPFVFFVPFSLFQKTVKNRLVSRTRIITTLRTRPVSLRPSGLTTSPLVPIGLVLRLLAVELAVGVLLLLEKLGFRRLGMMRTMAGKGVRAARGQGSFLNNCDQSLERESGFGCGAVAVLPQAFSLHPRRGFQGSNLEGVPSFELTGPPGGGTEYVYCISYE